MPRVSVIVPNYNHAPYLNQRIDSILNQTYQDFELILLDDCSTDNSKEILESYATNPKVSHTIINKHNSGSTFKQWNKGVELAKGEYIWIAESDDWAENDFLDCLVSFLDANSKIGLVYSNTNIYQDEKVISDFSKEKKRKFYLDYWDEDYIIDGNLEIVRILARDCTINNASAVLFRKKNLERIIDNLYSFRFSGDWFCYLQIAMESKIAYTQRVLNNYRDHTNNVSKKAGYNYLVELFHIYHFLYKRMYYERKLLIRYFHAYISDLYAMGLNWEPIRDIKILYKIDQLLYFNMTYRIIKRKMKYLIK